MGNPLRVLIVEDSEDDTLLLLRELQRSGYEVTSERVETAEKMRTALTQTTWDLIISDYKLPQFNALRALEVLQTTGLDLPFILISGTIGEEMAVAALKAGASNFLVKGKYAQLGPAIERELREAESRRQRRQAEAALRESQLQLVGIIESAMDAIVIIDEDQKITLFNQAAEKVFGYSAAEIIGQSHDRLVPERYRAGHKRLIERFAGTGVTSRTMASLQPLSGLRANGEEFPVEASISQIQIAGKKLFTVILSDITERKRAQEALSENEKLFRALTENISDVIAMVDQDGLITYASPGMTRVLGYAVGEIVGQNEFELIHPDDLEMARQDLKRVLEGQGSSVSFVVRERHKNGSWRWMEGVGTNLLAEPGVGKIVVNFRDITERVEAESRIKRQINRLNALRTIDMAISTSFDMKLSLTVLLNQAIIQLGVSAAAILLHNPDTLTLDYAVGKGFASSAIEQTRLEMGEDLAGRAILHRRKAAVINLADVRSRFTRRELLREEGFVSYYATPLIAKGELKGVLEVFNRSEFKPNQEWLDFVEILAGQAAIAIDNSTLFINLQRANAELEQRVAQRTEELKKTNFELERANRAKDEFLATMSHELRTPLNSILGLSETLLEQKRDPLSGHQQRSLQTISVSGHHLLELINDILDLSKIEAGKFDHHPQLISVDDLSRSSMAFVKEQATRKSITLMYQPDAAVPKIHADPRRIKQILVNLLTNAVKFTPANGQVILQVHGDVEHDRIQFSIIDTGIGIALEDLKLLFVPFSQVDSSLNRQFQGTGLGLALVQKLADMHGGSVDVKSEVGTGSRFTVNLPIGNILSASADPLPANDPEEKTTAQTSVKPQIILLAEDSMANILTISDYLESYHYQIVVARDGVAAMELAETHQPDLILMDIQMPVQDGLETIRRLRADGRFADTPIIALTALAMSGDRERCLAAGANEYMSKPASLKVLLGTIRTLLAKD